MNLFRILSVAVIFWASSARAEQAWSHAEYGAGNYGDSKVFSNPEARSNYQVLLATLDDLVSAKGPRGVFYINDLEEDWAQLAADTLGDYAKKQGWEIDVRVLYGDVAVIRLPKTQTAHLKNPSRDFINHNLRSFFLQRLADHSEQGLIVNTYFIKEFLNVSALTRTSVERTPGPIYQYIFPNGEVSTARTKKFLIRPNTNVTAEAQQLLGRPYEQVDRAKLQPSWCARKLREITINSLIFGK